MTPGIGTAKAIEGSWQHSNVCVRSTSSIRLGFAGKMAWVESIRVHSSDEGSNECRIKSLKLWSRPNLPTAQARTRCSSQVGSAHDTLAGW